ncbi:MAG: hypothetical protein ACI4L6_00685 [Candidatus Onthoplasma sp.]
MQHKKLLMGNATNNKTKFKDIRIFEKYGDNLRDVENCLTCHIQFGRIKQNKG